MAKMLKLNLILSHRKMKKFITLLFSLLICNFASALTLAEKLESSSRGDYIVTLMSKNYSLISIHTITDKSIIFEEITVPVSCVKRGQSWPEYLKNGAPKATSWVLYELDLSTGKMMECYSVLNDSFLDLSSFDSILSKMMYLPLKDVNESSRRKIGSNSALGGFDTRKLWNPPQKFEGKKQKKPKYNVYRATWPDDESILAGKTVELYFDKDKTDFPFPFWMQVKDESEAGIKLPTVDGGHNMGIGHATLPRRLPHFYDKVTVKDDEIVVKVNTPDYYEGLHLYFISYLPQLGDPVLSKAKAIKGEEKECVEFHIPKSFINESLDHNKPYHFMLRIDSHPDVRAESAKSVRFKGNVAK
ncbi:MAG: hypothetical protein P0S95_03245 [Rhabdochlamydiaceae bacterium]|nr:hypothetical protein [Candidatus Amphrikana amoebophyrae]